MTDRETIGELTGEGLRRARGLPAYEAYPEDDRETMTGGAVLWLVLGTVGLLILIAGLVGLVVGAHGLSAAFTMGSVAFRG